MFVILRTREYAWLLIFYINGEQDLLSFFFYINGEQNFVVHN